MSLTIYTPTVEPRLAGGDASPHPLVMIVDDHSDTRDMLRCVIEMIGCSVVEAADGEEAVRLTERRLPNLILMDTGLPGVDGYMATERIRKLKDGNKVTIIFLSGYADSKAHDRARAAGCDDYFVKPVNLEQLSLCVEKHLTAAAHILDRTNEKRTQSVVVHLRELLAYTLSYFHPTLILATYARLICAEATSR